MYSGKKRKMTEYFLIALVIVLVVTGQLLLKFGMQQIGAISFSREHLFQSSIKVITSPVIISGLILYFFSSFIWLFVISKAELSVVQPITALSYVLITFFSWLLFKEDVSLLRIAGVAAITLGVYLVARS
jgi:drug/metabolite transporter (DMT)-like permease